MLNVFKTYPDSHFPIIDTVI